MLDVVLPVFIVGVLAWGMFSYEQVSHPWTTRLLNDTTLSVLRGHAQVRHADGTTITIQAGSDIAVRIGDRIAIGPDSDGTITYFDGSTTQLDAGRAVTVVPYRIAGHVETRVYLATSTFGQ